jgi:hypothetical protein
MAWNPDSAPPLGPALNGAHQPCVVREHTRPRPDGHIRQFPLLLQVGLPCSDACAQGPLCGYVFTCEDASGSMTCSVPAVACPIRLRTEPVQFLRPTLTPLQAPKRPKARAGRQSWSLHAKPAREGVHACYDRLQTRIHTTAARKCFFFCPTDSSITQCTAGEAPWLTSAAALCADLQVQDRKPEEYMIPYEVKQARSHSCCLCHRAQPCCRQVASACHRYLHTSTHPSQGL